MAFFRRMMTVLRSSLFRLLIVASMALAGCQEPSATSGHQTSDLPEEPVPAFRTLLGPADALSDAGNLPIALAADRYSPDGLGRPLALGATGREDGGVGSFDAFLDEFLDALANGRTEGYIGHVRFPLPMVRFESSYIDPITGEHRRRDYRERRALPRSEFTPFLIHDPDAWSNAVYHLEDAFSAPGTRAIYRGKRMLTFAPVDGGWVLTGIGVCIVCGHPEVLLCARPGRQTEFPGRGPDGTEDFYAFFEVFYCAANSRGDSDRIPHLSRARTNPDGAALSRVRFPLRHRRAGNDMDAPVDRLITEDRFYLTSLFHADGGTSPPVMTVDGDTAHVGIHGMASGVQGGVRFSRIDGLWYLTGLGD